MDLRTLRLEVDELYADYVACLDEGELERWPEFFTDECLYQIVPRENYERRLPLALVLCESKGMLEDRVVAVRQTNVYGPRVLRHLVSSLRVQAANDVVIAQANFALFETTLDEPTQVFNSGRYLDRLVRVSGSLKFKEKLCVLDGAVIRGSLIYPI
ncbi:MAG TPA: aromatic-ring-hydroxylating dioxygenase subunit beta [Candidatus Kryptonia bacterium]|nr:aromatic-ring-hydroxylating dioxygenase subunit beta [Candidatus Kryptonia bacterium]